MIDDDRDIPALLKERKRVKKAIFYEIRKILQREEKNKYKLFS